MKHSSYIPEGVCARRIEFDIDDAGKVRNVVFTGGCNGNTQGVAALAEGRTPEELVALLRGIHCNGKPTSCPDQLAQAITQSIQE